MELSCGVVVTDGQQLLAIVPWGKKSKLDLPKGHIEAGETEAQCAVRELQEETGLRVNIDQLKPLGRFKYTNYKDLSLFLYRVSALPNLASLKCASMFTDPYGRKVPEATAFALVDFNDDRFYSSLKPVLFLVQKQL